MRISNLATKFLLNKQTIYKSYFFKQSRGSLATVTFASSVITKLFSPEKTFLKKSYPVFEFELSDSEKKRYTLKDQTAFVKSGSHFEAAKRKKSLNDKK